MKPPPALTVSRRVRRGTSANEPTRRLRTLRTRRSWMIEDQRLRRVALATGLALVAAVTAAGCGGGSDDSGTTAAAGDTGTGTASTDTGAATTGGGGKTYATLKVNWA